MKRIVHFNPDSVLRSADRVKRLSQLVKQHNDLETFQVLKRESSILLRRVIKFWVSLRVVRIGHGKR